MILKSGNRLLDRIMRKGRRMNAKSIIRVAYGRT